jgi:hypothetical protein
MPNCYYYDEQRNHCNCYVNANLNELLEENAKLRRLASGMYGLLELYDKIAGSNFVCETKRPRIFGEDKSFKDVMCELGFEVG